MKFSFGKNPSIEALRNNERGSDQGIKNSRTVASKEVYDESNLAMIHVPISIKDPAAQCKNVDQNEDYREGLHEMRPVICVAMVRMVVATISD